MVKDCFIANQCNLLLPACDPLRLFEYRSASNPSSTSPRRSPSLPLPPLNPPPPPPPNPTLPPLREPLPASPPTAPPNSSSHSTKTLSQSLSSSLPTRLAGPKLARKFQDPVEVRVEMGKGRGRIGIGERLEGRRKGCGLVVCFVGLLGGVWRWYVPYLFPSPPLTRSFGSCLVLMPQMLIGSRWAVMWYDTDFNADRDKVPIRHAQGGCEY